METDNQKLYELAYFLSPELNESDIPTYTEKIKKFISECGGSITAEIPAQKKKIGEPIKKFTFGYFGLFHFQNEPSRIEELKNNLKLEPKILRYMIIAQKPVSTAEKKVILKTPPKKVKMPTITTPAEIKSPEKPLDTPLSKGGRLDMEKEKVQMEELNKKLEEILKE